MNHHTRTYTNLVKIRDGLALLFGGSGHTLLGDTWLFTADINGVEDKNSISDDFHISPNPAEDYIEIFVGAIHELPLQSIKIFSTLGLKVLETEGKEKIDVSGLPSGVYFVRVGDKVGKFVKI